MTATQTQQLLLLPETTIKPKGKTIQLSELPPDAALYGEPPSDTFVANVKAFGILVPIILIEHATHGTYEVAAGRNRVRAARIAGLRTIPALIYPQGWVHSGTITLIENELRRKNALADLLAIERMVADGHTTEQIALATGMPPKTIDARMRLQALIPDLRHALLEGRIAISVAEVVCRLPDSIQQVCAAQLAIGGKLTSRDVAQIQRQAQQGAPTTPPAAALMPDDDQPAAPDAPTAAAAAEPTTWEDEVYAMLDRIEQVIPSATETQRLRDLVVELRNELISYEMGVSATSL